MNATFSGVSRGNLIYESKHVCNFLTIFTWHETRTKRRNMCASVSGVARDTDQGVATSVQVSRESHPSGTDGGRRRAVDRLRRARVDVPTAPLFFCSADGRWSPTCVYKFFCSNAWICARLTTDSNLVSVIPEKKGKKRKRQRSKMKNANL